MSAQTGAENGMTDVFFVSWYSGGYIPQSVVLVAGRDEERWGYNAPLCRECEYCGALRRNDSWRRHSPVMSRPTYPWLISISHVSSLISSQISFCWIKALPVRWDHCGAMECRMRECHWFLGEWTLSV